MSITGLPLHPLLVHLVVVLLPLTAVAAILVSVWPAARRKLTFLVPLAALGLLVVVPVTVEAGDRLAAQLHDPASFQRHRELGEGVLPWTIALFVLTAAQYAAHRFLPERRWVQRVVAVLVVVAAIGSLVQVVLTGDAGARLVWQGVGGAQG